MKKNKIIIGIFLSILYLPTLTFPFLGSMMPTDNTENRNLAQFPRLKSRRDIIKFPSSFDNYWSDNLPYRTIIKRAYEDLNLALFHTPSKIKVLVGKSETGKFEDSWLYFNGDGKPLDDVRGLKRLSPQQIENIKSTIIDQTEKMNKRGIKSYYFVTPNKSTIYPEYLPNGVQKVSDQSALDILTSEMNKVDGIHFKNLKDVLIAEKTKSNFPLYYRIDEHWNEYGAFIGVKEMLKNYYPDFSGLNDYEIIDDGITREGDGTNTINSNFGFYTPKYRIRIKNESDRIDIKEEETQRWKITQTKNQKPFIKQKVMYIGDSFKDAMIPTISKIFKESYVLHRDDFKEEMINDFSPDIIIFSCVERYMGTSLAFKAI